MTYSFRASGSTMPLKANPLPTMKNFQCGDGLNREIILQLATVCFPRRSTLADSSAPADDWLDLGGVADRFDGVA